MIENPKIHKSVSLDIQVLAVKPGKLFPSFQHLMWSTS